MAAPYVDPLVSGALPVGSPLNFMGGESRLQGHIYHVAAWNRWDDRRRVAFLRTMAERYGNDPALRWFTVQRILQPAGVAPMDYEGQARALLIWVQTQIYYANEPGEQIQSPWRTIAEGTGDCDDMALVLAALAHSIGLGFKFAIAGTDKQGRPVRWIDGERWKPAEYSHIYLQLGWPALNPQVWASAEPTLRGTPLGFDVVASSPLSASPLSVATQSGPPVRADLPGFGSPASHTTRRPHMPRGLAARYGRSHGDVAAVAQPDQPAPAAASGGWFPAPGELAREILLGVIVSAGTSFVIESLRPRRRG